MNPKSTVSLKLKFVLLLLATNFATVSALGVGWYLMTVGGRMTAEPERLILPVLFITIGVAALGALSITLILDRLVIGRLAAMGDAAEKIAAGDRSFRLPVRGDDEFTGLARGFNSMADSLVHAQIEADTDGLTGLYNFRHLQNFLSAQTALAQRYNRELSVAMLDIDHLKEVNDLFGHQMGDEVLKMTAGFLTVSLREVDYIARYGGEEFVVIMPETPVDKAKMVLERVRLNFPKKVYVLHKNKRNPVFATIGLADFPHCGRDPENLLGAADMALLLGKREGRNRISYFRDTDKLAG